MRTATKALLFIVILVAVGGMLAWKYGFTSGQQPVQTARSVPPPPPPTSLEDPLEPNRRAELSQRAPLRENWVSAPPDREFQYSRPASERQGVEPCAAPAPPAAKAARPLSRGYLFFGDGSALRDDGSFDLVMHLNGEGPVRRELVESKQPFILYTLTLTPDVSYAPLFAGSNLLNQLIDEISSTLTRELKRPAHMQHLVLSAWSAGYEGVRSILYQPEASKVEALLLIDGFHAPRGKKGLATHLAPFVQFAERARKGERFFALTHSSIPTVDFTSTTESAHFLIDALGGKPKRVSRDDGFGLELIEMFDAGNLHVRGYAGNDKADHCAQLFLLRGLFGAVHRYFHG